jgi:hypothetical protein
MFSDAGITLYHHPRFDIEVLCWLSASMHVHEHAFRGAFQVIEGSSVHAEYEFTATDEITADLKLGILSRRRLEMLVRGDIREIRPGSSFIHRLFHLDHPSLSLVIRTKEPINSQFGYFPPGAAFNDCFSSEDLMLKGKLLSVLQRARHPSFASRTSDFFERADFFSSAVLLRRMYPWLQQFGFFGGILDRFRERHGFRAEFLIACLEEARRARPILLARENLTNAEHRYFLALLLLLDTRREVFEWIEKRHGEDPKLLVARWLTEMATDKQFLQFGELEPGVLTHLLDAISLDELRQRLGDAHSSGWVEAQADKISQAYHRILSNPILRPLFR